MTSKRSASGEGGSSSSPKAGPARKTSIDGRYAQIHAPKEGHVASHRIRHSNNDSRTQSLDEGADLVQPTGRLLHVLLRLL